MLGFSLTKLVFTVLIVLAVWSAFKWWGRIQGERRSGLGRRGEERLRAGGAVGTASRSFAGGRAGGRAATGTAGPPVEDTEQCLACGAYVPLHSARRCGRADCPYRASP